MPIITLQFSITDAQHIMIDALRGSMAQDQFLRLALQMGLSIFQDEATRIEKENIFKTVGMLTDDFHHATITSAVKEPTPQDNEPQSKH